MQFIIYTYERRLGYYDWFRTNQNIGARSWHNHAPSECTMILHFEWDCP